jgi:hypothetical protein
MAYINPDWLPDTLVEFIVGLENIDKFHFIVDNNLEGIALEERVRVDDIPVDGSGFVTSKYVRLWGIFFLQELLFDAFDELPANEDIYDEKMDANVRRSQIYRNKLTQNSILGLAEEDGTPKGNFKTTMEIGRYSPTSRWNDNEADAEVVVV